MLKPSQYHDVIVIIVRGYVKMVCCVLMTSSGWSDFLSVWLEVPLTTAAPNTGHTIKYLMFLSAITGTIKLALNHLFKSLQLIWRSQVELQRFNRMVGQHQGSPSSQWSNFHQTKIIFVSVNHSCLSHRSVTICVNDLLGNYTTIYWC